MAATRVRSLSRPWLRVLLVVFAVDAAEVDVDEGATTKYG
jgi:hypothetical protein